MMRELHLVEVPPKPELEPYVGVLYCVNVAIAGMSPEHKCILLPNPCVDLIINLGGPFNINEHWQTYFQIDNLFNKNGPPFYSNSQNPTNDGINPLLYDTIGRMFHIGVRIND